MMSSPTPHLSGTLAGAWNKQSAHCDDRGVFGTASVVTGSDIAHVRCGEEHQ